MKIINGKGEGRRIKIEKEVPLKVFVECWFSFIKLLKVIHKY